MGVYKVITENDIIFDHLYDVFKDYMDTADEPIDMKDYMEDNGIDRTTMLIIYETYIYELKKRKEL